MPSDETGILERRNSEGDGSELRSALKAIHVMCGLQIAIGCLSLVAQGIFTGIILLHSQPELRHLLLSFGVPAGVLFIATGTIGLRLRRQHFSLSASATNNSTSKYHNKKLKALSSAFLGMSIVSCIAAGVLFAINGINLFWLSRRPIYFLYNHVITHSDIYLFQPLTGTLLGLGILELIVGAVCTCLCCSLRCYSGRFLERSISQLSGLYSSGRRLRTFIDYPNVLRSSMSSRTNSLARRGRSYSQTSLMPSPVSAAAPAVTRPVSMVGIAAAPEFAVGPPPSYEEAWNGRDGTGIYSNEPFVLRESRRVPRSGSNARLFQSLRESRNSRLPIV